VKTIQRHELLELPSTVGTISQGRI
jgi:hypothetical protein